MPTAPEIKKKPQDRQPKAAPAPTGFTFEHNGKTYSLPDAREGALDVPAKATREAVERPDDDAAQMRLSYAMLAAAKASQPARDALDEMTTRDMLTIVAAWMGESQGSSE